tara:strand:- start:359 stop:613 length:255 start_codon:yes stop_codon:yes gene_type:complete
MVLFGMRFLLLAGKRSPVRIRYSPPYYIGLQEFLTFEAFFICTIFAGKIGVTSNLMLFKLDPFQRLLTAFLKTTKLSMHFNLIV